MYGPLRKLAFAALAALVLPALAACQTAPATGKQIFTAGMGPEEEREIGQKEHPKILQQFGGAYEDQEVNAYVSSVGNLLARTSELPNLNFTFTVLDTPIVNAFALPGGYVYITRGLMALAENEAEVAGVLAHEIGHVTARHSAERYGSTVAASVATTLLGVLTGGGAVSRAAGGASVLALQSYSRDQEFEADTLGVRYLSRVGYDPAAMSSFLAKLQGHSRLEAELRGQKGAADEFSLLQTHPRTADRIERAIQAAGTKSVKDPIVGQDVYFSKIDGLLYGDDPSQGLIRGRTFAHPDLGFAFEVPEGYRLFNSPAAVLALGPEKSRIIFDRAPEADGRSMPRYLTEVWAAKAKLSDVEGIDVNGLPAATARARISSREGRLDGRLVAIRYDADTVYRFLFVTPPSQTQAQSVGLRRTTYSFRKLSPAEAAELKPQRIKIHTVRRGETVSDLVQRMPYSDYREQRFLTLNGMKKGEVLKAGQKVKLIEE